MTDGLVMKETPMIFTVPSAGKYCIGVDYGSGEDVDTAAVVRAGENGQPDELVAVLRRDPKTGSWVQE